jgi:hypothetical protein
MALEESLRVRYHYGTVSVLSHPNRKKEIQVLTLDTVLADDVAARMRDDARLAGANVVLPSRGAGGIEPQAILAMAQATVKAKVLILDVRSTMLPRLQEAYNRISGYNRRDFNKHCYSVVLSDGPTGLFSPGTGMDLFVPLLAKFRIDYNAACLFFDPFVHYTQEERLSVRIGQDASLPAGVPKRLARFFKEDVSKVEEVRRFFRAAEAATVQRPDLKARRLAGLVKLLQKRTAEAFPSEAAHLGDLYTREGLFFQREPLSLRIYPFFFEDMVADLLSRLPPKT